MSKTIDKVQNTTTTSNEESLKQLRETKAQPIYRNLGDVKNGR